MLSALYRLRFDYRRRRGLPKLVNQLNTGLVNVTAGIACAISPPRAPRRDAACEPVVVSLTSYGPRARRAVPCLMSLLKQDHPNFRVILWLSQDEFKAGLPPDIRRLQHRGLEVELVEDLRSYKKVYFAARRFPGLAIVTADDDFLYPETWLSELTEAHARAPGAVVCHRCHEMLTDGAGALLGYEQWNWYANGVVGPSHALHILSGAGALFPAGFFDEPFFDWETIRRLCPTTDDIWLKLTALRQGVPVVKVRTYTKSLVCVRGTQDETLYGHNRRNANDEALAALQEHFGLNIAAMLEEEKGARRI